MAQERVLGLAILSIENKVTCSLEGGWYGIVFIGTSKDMHMCTCLQACKKTDDVVPLLSRTCIHSYCNLCWPSRKSLFNLSSQHSCVTVRVEWVGGLFTVTLIMKSCTLWQWVMRWIQLWSTLDSSHDHGYRRISTLTLIVCNVKNLQQFKIYPRQLTQ